MRIRRIAILFATFIACCVFSVSGKAQAVSPCPVMPDGYLCISRAAAQAALEAGDKAKALQAENDDLKTKVIPQLKDALADMRVQYAECKGESTILKQRAVSDAAMIELFSKLVRPKKFGIIVF